MIGVLAVIAILAAMLIPKIFTAIRNSRIDSAVTAISTIKQAVADSYAKYGGFTTNAAGTMVAYGAVDDFGAVLMSQGFVDKPFAVKIGNQTAETKVQIRTIEATTIDATTANYDLDGDGAPDTDNGALVVECVITGVTAQDCKDIKNIIDGTSAALDGAVAATGPATKGRVKYGKAGAAIPAGDTGTALIYITHR